MPQTTSVHFEMNLDSQNAAFCDDPKGETIRLLKEVINHLETGTEALNLRDINGNPAGDFDFNAEESPTLEEWSEENEEEIKTLYLAAGHRLDQFPDGDFDEISKIVVNIETIYSQARADGVDI